jgi:hypothetical protein
MAHDNHMARDDPVYTEAMDELYDFGIKDVLDMERLGATHLATFGSLGKLRAKYLLEYAHEKVIAPLGLMKTERTRRSNPSIEEIAPPAEAPLSGVGTQDDGWPTTLPIKKEEGEVILNWFESVQDGEETTDKEVDELESTDESGRDSDGDVARFPSREV